MFNKEIKLIKSPLETYIRLKLTVIANETHRIYV